MINTLYTYQSGRVLLEPAMNPFNAGDRVIIPKGTWVRRFFQKNHDTSRRRSVVTVSHVQAGYLDRGFQQRVYQPTTLVDVKPTITWAGSGGYWAECDLSEEVLAANGMSYRDLEPNLRSLRMYRHDIEQLIKDGTL